MKPVQIIFNLAMCIAGIAAVWLVPPALYQVSLLLWFCTNMIANAFFDYHYPKSISQPDWDEHSKWHIFLRAFLAPFAVFVVLFVAWYFLHTHILIMKIVLTILLLAGITKMIFNWLRQRTLSQTPA
jgi:hypothetical protein